MSIQEKAIQTAILRLRALGAQFHILTEDGKEYGARIRKRGPSTGPKNADYIATAIARLAVGDSRILPVQEGDELRRFGKHIAAWCSKNWGNGSYVTASDAETQTVEVLRLQ